MAFKTLDTYDSSALDDFRSLRGKSGHLNRGIFIAEAPKIVRKVLESGFEVPVALLTQEYFEEFRDLFENRSDVTQVFLAAKPEMEQIVGYPLHQGAMLAVRIPKSKTIEDAAITWPESFIVVALDGIADAENMGAIIRNAAAFGANAILVDEQSCNPYLRRSVRVSMGTITDIEIIRESDLTEALNKLKKIRDVMIIGATLSERSVPLSSIERAGNAVVVFGSEGWGIRKAVLDSCDTLVQIPISSDVDSLNVSIASGIFLYVMCGAGFNPRV